MSVNENRLSHLSVLKPGETERMLGGDGCGWVARSMAALWLLPLRICRAPTSTRCLLNLATKAAASGAACTTR